MTSFSKLALSAAALLLTPVSAEAATTVISLDRAPAYGVVGADGNTVVLRDIGAFAHITSIAYSVTVEALDPSYLSDQQAWFGTTDSYWATYTPAADHYEEGTMTFEGNADLVAIGIDFSLNDDGVLRLALADNYNSEPTPHGFWSGTFTITSSDPVDGAVPEPATWAMMIAGFGVVGASLRRRRSVALKVAHA